MISSEKIKALAKFTDEYRFNALEHIKLFNICIIDLVSTSNLPFNSNTIIDKLYLKEFDNSDFTNSDQIPNHFLKQFEAYMEALSGELKQFLIDVSMTIRDNKSIEISDLPATYSANINIFKSNGYNSNRFVLTDFCIDVNAIRNPLPHYLVSMYIEEYCRSIIEDCIYKMEFIVTAGIEHLQTMEKLKMIKIEPSSYTKQYPFEARQYGAFLAFKGENVNANNAKDLVIENLGIASTEKFLESYDFFSSQPFNFKKLKPRQLSHRKNLVKSILLHLDPESTKNAQEFLRKLEEWSSS